MDRELDVTKKAQRSAPRKKAMPLPARQNTGTGGQEPLPGLASRPAQSPRAAPQPQRVLSSAAEATIARDLDLFGITRPRHACACPDCRRELSMVECLGRKLKGCLHCRGVWFPLGVIKTFDRDGAWLKHLGPAIQAAMQSRISPKK